MHTIYLLTNNVNRKIYVGVTNNYKKRMIEHKASKSNTLISRAIRKYGWDNFTPSVLCITENREAEITFIEQYNSFDTSVGYNLTRGGEGTLGFNPSQETREKMRQAKLGKTHTNRSYKPRAPHTKETKAKISEKLKGNKHFQGKTFSEETKKLLSELRAKTWLVKNPEGNIIEVYNMQKFCLENNLHNSAISGVLAGKRSHHKGWTKP